MHNIHSADWLTERLNSQPTKQKRERAKSARPFKPGPRDIGRIKSNGWKPIEYKETDNSGFVTDKFHHAFSL